ncbi:DNA-binding response regulator, NarL/FixJ family, contains REC and HTH domains [Amycolatopsis xylanica]|uniref:DNA-binding response regulator, NarL/FixJ family, contains REC and HTH domains n=1 Tax=Amycolatopsis xylanica TaxID=589385 RepID=A0A1H2UP03_9PSEU|nr:DNA-binding response regulator, NarL/FixJ family, contains REC and HTH domains [Amycolatopsis xylanica]
MLVCDPGADGLALIAERVRAAPGARVLVVAPRCDDESVLAALRAGAHGYLLDTADRDDVARAVRAVDAGGLVLAPPIADRLANLLSAPESFDELTARQRAVLDLLAAGMDNAVIARQLRLAPKTVRNHLSAIFARYRFTSRADAITRARAAGFGRDKPQVA